MSENHWEYSVVFKKPDGTWTFPKEDPEAWGWLESTKEWASEAKERGLVPKIVQRRVAGPIKDYEVNG